MASAPAIEVKQNDKVGRYTVAARALAAGEVVVNELPFMLGPKLDTVPLCLGCLAPVDTSVTCTTCGWPVCSAECEAESMHADSECKAFSACGVKFVGAGEGCEGSCPQYECISPLRMLLAREQNPDRWGEVEILMTHEEKRKQLPQWEANKVNVVNFLRERCKLADRFSEQDIHDAIGILEVNGFEARTPSGAAAVALYPKTALLSHNCVANTAHSITPTSETGERYRIIVRASVAVSAGEELYSSYTHCMDPTMLRREHLSLSKFFDCDCKRCTDPTELGTHMSSLKCTKCDNGVVLSSNPLDASAPWKCTHCENSLRAEQVRRVLALVQSEIETVDLASEELGEVECREKLLRQYRTVFHPRHALVLGLKHTLAQLYGRAEGYYLDDLPDILLERKVELCKEVFAALDVVAPGLTRIRGLTLYELHVPMILLARSRFQVGVLVEAQLRKELQAAAAVLQQAVDILTLEDPTTPEGSVGAVARESLQQLQASIETLPAE